MVDTIPANTSTFATVSVNGFVYDTIETVGDVDWYKVTLSAGHYHINLGGDPLFGNAGRHAPHGLQQRRNATAPR